jgi:hypothetical protein
MIGRHLKHGDTLRPATCVLPACLLGVLLLVTQPAAAVGTLRGPRQLLETKAAVRSGAAYDRRSMAGAARGARATGHPQAVPDLSQADLPAAVYNGELASMEGERSHPAIRGPEKMPHRLVATGPPAAHLSVHSVRRRPASAVHVNKEHPLLELGPVAPVVTRCQRHPLDPEPASTRTQTFQRPGAAVWLPFGDVARGNR